MIVKKIKNPAKSASKAMRVNGLANYIASPEKTNADEKCVYQGSRGFLTESFEAQKAEMLALAQEAVRSRDPINHYVMSWKENEHPSPQQIEEAVDIFLQEMGLEDHQAIYGLHADTANLHLHVMVNRVHPDSLKVIKPNRGFDIEAAHRAIARIEHVQGWERERHGRYQVLDMGEVERDLNGLPIGLPSELQSDQTEQDRAGIRFERQRQPEQGKRDMEERTGEKSAERIAIEDAAPILRDAKSWADVHRGLAEIEMRYEKVGSGAVVFVGDVGVKASRTDRAASLLKMEKRLGKFAPAVELAGNSVARLVVMPAAHSSAQQKAGSELKAGVTAAPRQLPRSPRLPIPVAKGVAHWPEYIGGRHAHYATKTVAVEEQKGRHLLERRVLSEAQKATRRDILVNGPDAGKQSYQGVWKGKSELRQAIQSILAAEQAGERAQLKDRHQREREILRERFAPYPDFEVWLRERGRPELAEQWRYRDRDQEIGRESDRASGWADERKAADSRLEVGRIMGVGLANGDEENSISVVAAPRDIRNYEARIHGREVYYSRRPTGDLTDLASGSTKVAFVDKGREIEVRDWRSDDSLLAALQLSAQKWGELRVTGSDAYKARCAALAVEHGFKIVNPELQEQIVLGIQAKRVIAQEGGRAAPRSDHGLQAPSFGSLADIYQRHHEDVIRREGRRERAESRADPSRVDAMIAVRMRVTGHDQAAIMEVLRQCSPGTHGRSPTDGRDWSHYAQRTAQYAFSPAGTRRLEQLVQYREKWERLEGREREVSDLSQSPRNRSHESPTRDSETLPNQGRRGPSLSR